MLGWGRLGKFGGMEKRGGEGRNSREGWGVLERRILMVVGGQGGRMRVNVGDLC